MIWRLHLFPLMTMRNEEAMSNWRRSTVYNRRQQGGGFLGILYQFIS
jgi:hypothetical protein